MADNDIIAEALERFEESDSETRQNRQDAHDDITFSRLSDQWPDAIRTQREAEGRPCLTVNRLPSFIRSVVNDARHNKPAIQVHPVDNGADVATAEVINGIVRSIERRSNAEVAYDTAIDSATSGGFGFFQIGIEYAHDDSFDLEARIERIANPLMVHWDPASTRFDASDWDYCFVSDFISKERFAHLYPDADPVDWEGSDTYGEMWMLDDKVRISDYWLREQVKRTIVRMSNGVVYREDDLAKEQKLEGFGNFAEAMSVTLEDMLNFQGIVRTNEVREVDTYNVVRRKISGVDVLSEDKWPGPTIPICPVWGEEIVADGRRHFRSLIRDAKDPQSMVNFWRTASTELVALAPKAPFIGPRGFTAGMEDEWASANTRSHATLEYDPAAGPMPQRQPFAGVPAGALQESLNASDDMKSVIGIYNASLGARSNETSGRAILARQREADVSTFHFIDNLNRAIRYAGQVLVDIIPSVYSPRRTVRILGEDSLEEVISLASQPPEIHTASFEDEGGPLYDLSVGVYDVDVKAGPSYGSQREETRETLIEIIRALPGAAPLLGDVLMEHMDFVGSDRVAERLKMMLPPQIQQAEGIAPPPQPLMPSGGLPPMPGQPIPGQPITGGPIAPQPIPSEPIPGLPLTNRQM